MSRESIERSQFHVWSQYFDGLAPHVCIPLDDEFLAYLDADGIYVASDNKSFLNDGAKFMEDDESSGDDENVYKGHIIDEIDRFVDEYGDVFPKLNWSAPSVCLCVLYDI